MTREVENLFTEFLKFATLLNMSPNEFWAQFRKVVNEKWLKKEKTSPELTSKINDLINLRLEIEQLSDADKSQMVTLFNIIAYEIEYRIAKKPKED